LKKLKPEDVQDTARVRKSAMDYLARREHGERELAAKLTAKGFSGERVAEALARLVEDGLLSDRRFAGSFIRARFQRGAGPLKIRAELRARGIDDGLITDRINGYADQWQSLVTEVRERKYGIGRPTDFRERSRQMRFLQQRGFTAEQISQVFRDE
jgi:regulatory protein